MPAPPVETPAPPPVEIPAPPPEMPAEPVTLETPETPDAPEAVAVAADAAPAPADGRGWVLVRTTPPGAGVTVDGAERGVTPLSIGGVPFGSQLIEVRREGFQPATQQVALSPSSPVAAVELTLAPLAAVDEAPPAAVPGSLLVESRPPGARVLVGGSSAGTTPTVVSGLAAGPHEVRIELEGYLPWVASVDVQAAGELRVAASLEGVGAR